MAGKEDALLDVMTRIEAEKNTLKEDMSQFSQLEADWQQEKQALMQKQRDIKKQTAELSQKRASLVSSIDDQSISLYVSVQQKKGIAVVRVEQGICQGCRINLSMNELQRARTGIVQCSSCGKILFAG